jgi:hypothetical protein
MVGEPRPARRGHPRGQTLELLQPVHRQRGRPVVPRNGDWDKAHRIAMDESGQRLEDAHGQVRGDRQVDAQELDQRRDRAAVTAQVDRLEGPDLGGWRLVRQQVVERRARRHRLG